jgi:hypothetical protein
MLFTLGFIECTHAVPGPTFRRGMSWHGMPKQSTQRARVNGQQANRGALIRCKSQNRLHEGTVIFGYELQEFVNWLVANGVQGIGADESKVAIYNAADGRGITCTQAWFYNLRIFSHNSCELVHHTMRFASPQVRVPYLGKICRKFFTGVRTCTGCCGGGDTDSCSTAHWHTSRAGCARKSNRRIARTLTPRCLPPERACTGIRIAALSLDSGALRLAPHNLETLRDFHQTCRP